MLRFAKLSSWNLGICEGYGDTDNVRESGVFIWKGSSVGLMISCMSNMGRKTLGLKLAKTVLVPYSCVCR